MRVDPRPRTGPPAPVRVGARAGSVLALLVFGLLATGGAPSALLAEGPFSADFFDAQAEAILDGRLDVPPEVAGLEGFVHDDRTHLYFGIVPALLRLPVAAVSDGFAGRLGVVSMLAALGVATWAAGRLLWRARARVRGDAPVAAWEPWAAGAFVAAVGISSPVLLLAARPVVYHEVELWGTATALVAMDLALAWWHRPSGRRLAVAALGATAALNTRASTGGGALAALGLVFLLALWWRRVPWRSIPALGLALLVPVAAYATVNAARFGTPFDVPFEDQVQSGFDPPRQAALEATDGTLFGPEFAPSALVAYLRPDGVRPQALFPWITFRESQARIGDPTFDTVERTASLPVTAPALVALAVAGAVTLSRDRRRDPWPALAAGSAVGLVSTLTIAIVANRYLADFTPTLVVLAGVGVWPVAGWVQARRRGPRAAGLAALGTLGIAGLLVNGALAIQVQRLLFLPERSARLDFVELQYDLHDRFQGGRPPAVERVASVQDRDGERGDVAIQGDCEALWWHDGERWWPLELAGELAWHLEGRLGAGRTTLVEGDGWSIVAERDGDRVRFAYRAGGRERATGQPLPRSDVEDRPITVRLDRANREAFVEVDGDLALVAWLAELPGPVKAGERWQARRGTAAVCEELAARLR